MCGDVRGNAAPLPPPGAAAATPVIKPADLAWALHSGRTATTR